MACPALWRNEGYEAVENNPGGEWQKYQNRAIEIAYLLNWRWHEHANLWRGVHAVEEFALGMHQEVVAAALAARPAEIALALMANRGM